MRLLLKMAVWFSHLFSVLPNLPVLTKLLLYIDLNEWVGIA